MSDVDIEAGRQIQLNPQKWNLKLSTNIWAYSTTVMFILSTVVTYYADLTDRIGESWYDTFYQILCTGVLLVWSLACYAEAYAINSLRKERLKHGISSNGDKFLIAFWFASFLFLLIPVITIVILLIM